MKLEQPEIAGYIQNVILEWMPLLFIDGHNGGSFPYNLNYQCASHNAPDPRISQLCDTQIFPAIDKRLATDSFKSFYYQRGDEKQWNVGGSEPRISRNYARLHELGRDPVRVPRRTADGHRREERPARLQGGRGMVTRQSPDAAGDRHARAAGDDRER